MDYAKVRKVFGNEVTQRATELKKRTTEYFKGFLCGSLFFLCGSLCNLIPENRK